MAKINELSTLDALSAGDSLPVYDASNSDTRKVSVSTLSNYISTSLVGSVAAAASTTIGTNIVIASDYDYLDEAIAVLVSGDVLYVPEDITLSASAGTVTMPYDNVMTVTEGAQVYIPNGQTFVVAGRIIAEPNQVLYLPDPSGGAFIFGADYAYDAFVAWINVHPLNTGVNNRTYLERWSNEQSDAGGGRIRFAPGVYPFRATSSGSARVFIRDDISFHLDDGAVIKMDSSTDTHLFTAASATSGNNWKLIGGKIDGDNTTTNKYINLGVGNSDTVRNIQIKGVEFANAGSYAVSVQGSVGDVRFEDCEFHDCSRGGIAVTGCRGLVIRNCRFNNNATGTGNSGVAHVDLESENNSSIEDVQIIGNHFYDSNDNNSLFLHWGSSGTPGREITNVLIGDNYFFYGGEEESLTDGDFSSSTNWDDSDSQWSVSGGSATYTFSGTGTAPLTQDAADLAVGITADRWYKFQYTVTESVAFDGDGTFQLDTTVAVTATTIPHTTGTHLLYFYSAASPTDFTINAVTTSGTVGTYAFDDLSLIEIEGTDNTIQIQGDATGKILDSITVRNNFIYGGEAGISAIWADNVCISNNTIKGCSLQGISTNDSQFLSIVGNTINRCGDTGIRLLNDADRTHHFVCNSNVVNNCRDDGIDIRGKQGVVVGNNIDTITQTGFIHTGTDNAMAYNASTNATTDNLDITGSTSAYQYVDGSGTPALLDGVLEKEIVSAAEMVLPGAASDPDRDTTTGLLLFDSGATETIAGVFQLPRGWVDESAVQIDLVCRAVVATDPGAGPNNVVAWQLEYKVYDEDGTYPSSYTTSTNDATLPAHSSSDPVNTLVEFSSITTTGLSHGAQVEWKISRLGADGDDTYGDDCTMVSVALRYSRDRLGGV